MLDSSPALLHPVLHLLGLGSKTLTPKINCVCMFPFDPMKITFSVFIASYIMERFFLASRANNTKLIVFANRPEI